MAFLHVIFNLENGRYVTPDSELDVLRQKAIKLNPTERAQLLYDSKFLEEAHMDAATFGYSTFPSPAEDNHHHYVAFVQKDGQVWELNGGMNGPLVRGRLGEGEDLLSEQGMKLTVGDFLDVAGQDAIEISITAVTGPDAVCLGSYEEHVFQKHG